MNVCTLYQPGLLDMPAFWIALGAAVFVASFSVKRGPAGETAPEAAPQALETA